MSEELSLQTKDVLKKKLVSLQGSSAMTSWANREPQTWMASAKHIMEPSCSVNEFLAKNKMKRNAYFDLKRDLLKDDDCKQVRAAWGDEIASMQFQGFDTARLSQEKYSEEVALGNVKIDAKELFMQTKSLMGLGDLHAKLTGNNVQIHRVEHVGQQDYDNKRDEIKARIAKARAASVEGVIDLD
jgi:hypothetical protein